MSDADDLTVAFRERSRRLRAWGIGLLSLAGLLWAWCAVLLLTPYETERTLGSGRVDTTECESRLFTEGDTANEGRWSADWCEAERDWPEITAFLALSLPVSIAGTVVFMTGAVSVRISEHDADVAYFRQRDARTTP
jgi:hypothetical protein